MKILVTGASGLFGSKLAELASEKKHTVFSGFSKDAPKCGIPVHVDVSEKEQVQEAMQNTNPSVVVHAAAFTDVDKCETNHELAWKINVEGTRNIVEAANAGGAFLIFISTDYVFDGEKGRYTETDVPKPISYYGLTKLEAEKVVQERSNEYCIGRASVLYGATPAVGKTNFALWVLEKLKKKEQARVVTDQWNSPTLNTNLAEMTLEIAERRLASIYHLSGATRISRFDFAKMLARTFSMDEDLIVPSLSSEFSWPAKRPRDSSLDTTKAQETLSAKPMQIEAALKQLKRELSAFS